MVWPEVDINTVEFSTYLPLE